MFDIAIILVGVLGFAYIGYKDLKTTEFPDWVPYLMIGSAILVNLINAAVTNDFSTFTAYMINGSLLLGVGYIMYLAGGWADGDAFALGALGFLFPINTSLFNPVYFLPLPIMLISNVFILGGAYMVIYALGIGAKNAWIFAELKKDLFKNANKLALILL